MTSRGGRGFGRSRAKRRGRAVVQSTESQRGVSALRASIR